MRLYRVTVEYERLRDRSHDEVSQDIEAPNEDAACDMLEAIVRLGMPDCKVLLTYAVTENG